MELAVFKVGGASIIITGDPILSIEFELSPPTIGGLDEGLPHMATVIGGLDDGFRREIIGGERKPVLGERRSMGSLLLPERFHSINSIISVR